MTNRIDNLFETKKGNILSVYFTAGFPNMEDTVTIIQSLQDSGCDMVEIGIPFSDPLADGPVIQASSTKALHNGMTVKKIIEQLSGIRNKVQIPLILMGYFNPVLQYGVEKFGVDISTIGIDGLIIPDMPPDVFITKYQGMFEKHDLHNILLITPSTSDERIREIEKACSGFIYAVASSSTTGSTTADKSSQQKYFERIRSLRLKLPVMAGFGISNREQFLAVCKFVRGGIIGSAFIKHIEQNPDLKTSIPSFIKSLINDSSVSK